MYPQAKNSQFWAVDLSLL